MPRRHTWHGYFCLTPARLSLCHCYMTWLTLVYEEMMSIPVPSLQYTSYWWDGKGEPTPSPDPLMMASRIPP
eukprot:7298672-Ditylum_brightwellii.AAC.1